MANRYWVGGSANWDGTAGTKWALTPGGAGGQAVPTSSDDVFFDASSGAVTITIAANVNCNNLTCTGFTGTLTSSGGQLSIYASLLLVAGMTFTVTVAVYFKSTSTGQTITTAGKSIPGVTFDGVGGGWQLQDNWAGTTAGDITLTNGTLDINGKTVTIRRFSSDNSNTRTLTLGAAAITCTTSGGSLHPWSFGTTTGLTVTANTAVVTFADSPAPGYYHFNSGPVNYNGLDLVFNAAGNFRLNPGNCTLADITRASTAVKTNTIRFASDVTITGTLALAGNSAVNRLLVCSGNATIETPGETRTITNTGATMNWSYVDFQDIALTTSYDASAITGLSGDCGGNSNITFTPSQNHYWVGNAGSWSATGEWSTSSGGSSGARVPLPQDDCYFDNASFNAARTVTLDMPRAGRSINWSAYTEGDTQTITLSVNTVIYGSLTLITANALGGNFSVTFAGRSSYTLTSAGETFYNFYLNAPGGTLTCQDALVSSGTVTVYNGTLVGNGFSITALTYAYANFDTVTLSDASAWELVGGGPDLGQAFSDTLTLSDAYAALMTHFLEKDDTNTLDDIILLNFTYLSSTEDTLALADDFSFIPGMDQLVEDTLILSDSQSILNSYLIELTGTNTLSDGINLLFAYLLALNDTGALSDDVLAELLGDVAQVASASDTLVLTDEQLYQLDYLLELADTGEILDSAITDFVEKFITTSETITITDEQLLNIDYLIETASDLNNFLDLSDAVLSSVGPDITLSISDSSPSRRVLLATLN